MISYISASVCIFLYFLLDGTEGQIKGEPLSFKLSAINLPGMDPSGYSDAYVRAFSKDQYTRFGLYEQFGETSTSYWSQNPKWSSVFHFKYVNGTRQKWRFIVKDYDVGWNYDDNLGRVDVDVEDLVAQMRINSGNGTLRTTEPIKLFLTQPKGGVLILTPVPTD